MPRCPAFSDSVAASIGIETTASQVSVTRRDRPLPSEPTTMTIGRSAKLEPRQRYVAVAVELEHEARRGLLQRLQRLRRFGAIATGMRVAAPADVFHAAAVTPPSAAGARSTPCRRTLRSSGGSHRGCGGR